MSALKRPRQAWRDTPTGQIDALARQIDGLFAIHYPHGQALRPNRSQIRAVIGAVRALERTEAGET